MYDAHTTTSRSTNASTNDYGPNKGPRVGDNDITESSLPNATDVITTEWPPAAYTENIVNFPVVQSSPTTTTDSGEPTETTTIDVDDGTTAKGPKVRYETTLDSDEPTTPTMFVIDTTPNEMSTAIPNVVTGKTVLPMQCNNVNDCAPNERCINNKCTQICDPTNSNRSSVDCIQGICK